MRALLIDSAAREIREVEWTGGLAEMRALIGCRSIDLVSVRLPHGDTLWVDDEGLLVPQAHFFEFSSYPQPLAGNGLVIGREVDEKQTPAATRVEQLQALIRFRSRGQVDAWGKANASEPAISITSMDGKREVLQTYGGLIAGIPKVPGEDRG